MVSVPEQTICPMCGGSGRVAEALLEPSEQTVADHDQDASDRDQTWSDRDQSASDEDQRSADEDQLASDQDLARGGDRAVHNRSLLAREAARRDRAAVAALRDENAATRLRDAEERDRIAASRDAAAAERDRLALEADADLPEAATLQEALHRAETTRRRAAAARTRAAEDRAKAAADREQASRERAEAARAFREALDELAAAGTDQLTGAWMRRFGLADIDRELERARRTGGGLTLAFVDVDGLKQINDRDGHAEGDWLLQVVADALRAHLRPYDMVVRYGGDEFLCVMPNLSRVAAQRRMEGVAAFLSATDPRGSISFGLAEAGPTDDHETLIARADAELLATRRCSNPGR